MTRRVRWTAAALYVGVVAALAANAFSDANGSFGRAEGAAMLLTLPALVIALPVIYVLGATIWNLTDAGDGGPMWPVTVVYTLMFAGVAIANLRALWLLREWRRHRSDKAKQQTTTA